MSIDVQNDSAIGHNTGVCPAQDITVVVLTKNEAANIFECLSQLAWARRVLVVDSFSDDGTATIAETFDNVEFVSHQFVCHADQWNFAVNHPDVKTDWVLCLDADYRVPDSFVSELSRLSVESTTDALSSAFDFYVEGREVSINVYGRKPVMFRTGRVSFVQQGHTQVPIIAGGIIDLGTRLIHDDRKPTQAWLQSQWRYAVLEANYLHSDSRSRRWVSRLRRWPRLSLPIIFIYLGIFRGLLFRRTTDLHYLLQRIVAEALIAKATIRESELVDGNDAQSRQLGTNGESTVPFVRRGSVLPARRNYESGKSPDTLVDTSTVSARNTVPRQPADVS